MNYLWPIIYYLLNYILAKAKAGVGNIWKSSQSWHETPKEATPLQCINYLLQEQSCSHMESGRRLTADGGRHLVNGMEKNKQSDRKEGQQKNPSKTMCCCGDVVWCTKNGIKYT